MDDRVLGGVLVGGGSRRMGRDKAVVEVGGRALAERVAGALAGRVGEVVVLGDGVVPEGLEGLRRLGDAPLGGREGRQGPLAGIVAALRSEREAAWVIASCDLPHVSGEAVDWLLAQRREGIAAVLPRVAEGAGRPGAPQPLLALYEPAALPLVERLLAEGRRGPRHLAGRAGVASPAVPARLAPAWSDVDTPADLEAARRRHGAGDGG